MRSSKVSGSSRTSRSSRIFGSSRISRSSKVSAVWAILLPGAIALIAACGTAAGSVSVIPIARNSDASPDGNGTFGGYFDYGEPCLNDSDQVAFSVRLSGTVGGGLDNEAIVRGAARSGPALIVREGDAVPGGTGLFGALDPPLRQYSMNNGGRIAFTADLTGTPGGTADNQGLYSSAGAGTIIEHARRGHSATGTTYLFNGLYPPYINNEMPASVAFLASLGSGSIPTTVYIGRAETLTLVAWAGQPAPDHNGTISRFFDSDPPAVRPNASEVAFWAHLNGTALGFQDDDGIFRASGGVLTQLARGGGTAPDGHIYQDMYGPTYNIQGNAAAYVQFYPYPSAGEGVVIVGDTSDDLAAARHWNLPDSTGALDGFWHPSLSAGNVSAFKAELTSTPLGGLDDRGIYRGDGTILIQVARENDPVPEGGGRFADFGEVVGINLDAEVLFTATLRNTPGGSSDNRGLYLWNENRGITKLLRTGDVIGGGPVTDFSTLTSRDFGGFRCLNDAEEAVARVRCGRDGIYLFRVETEASVDGGAGRGEPLKIEIGPNPFTSGPVVLRYEMPRAGGAGGSGGAVGTVGPVAVTIHDAAGREVGVMRNDVAGRSGSITWDGNDASGRTVPSGVYFVRVQTREGVALRRLIRLRSN